MANCEQKAVARKGWLHVRESSADEWVNVGGITSIGQSSENERIECDDYDTKGQKPYKNDLSEVTFDLSFDYMARDAGQIILQNSHRFGVSIEYRYAEDYDPGSDAEMQIGTISVDSFGRDGSKGDLATRSASCTCFNIDYTDQSGLSV